MPSDLEMRLLSSMLIDLDASQLRRVVIHVAEKEFEVVGAEVLRIKEEMRIYQLVQDQVNCVIRTKVNRSSTMILKVSLVTLHPYVRFGFLDV